MSEDQASFDEVQRFRQWWAVATIVVTAAVVWLVWTEQVVLGAPVGEDPAPDAVLWIMWVVFGLGFPVALWRFRLVTRVRPGSISVGFPPFPSRVVSTDDIVEARAEQIRPITRWGGYGYRRDLRGGTAFIVRGRMAVELVLARDQRLVIGTQQPVRLATAIAEARRLGSSHHG
jgi:hypothetical protein